MPKLVENMAEIAAAAKEQAENWDVEFTVLHEIQAVRFVARHKTLVGVEKTVFVPVLGVLKLAGHLLMGVGGNGEAPLVIPPA